MQGGGENIYEVEWDKDTGGVTLHPGGTGIGEEIRPVFFEELDALGFHSRWIYPKTAEPLLWAIGRRYYYRGDLVAEARGGGFFEMPTIEYCGDPLVLDPVALEEMLDKNEALLEGLVQTTVEFICRTRERYRTKVDVAAVAFSGGKDSLVLLDLVQRALLPRDFVVVFSDTTMEIAPTLDAVAKAREKWQHLTFHVARSAKPALASWREFGPPSRLQRWCCTVHKSAPTLLLLRTLAGKAVVRALVYDGVRRDESQTRAGYLRVSEGAKHSSQTNASPLLGWNSAEVFLYLLARRICFNDAYRHGFPRVGCAVCPFASEWTNLLSWLNYPDDVTGFISILREYGHHKGVRRGEIDSFIRQRGWTSRAGGRDVPGGGARVLEVDDGDTASFLIRTPREDWLEWAKTLGQVTRDGHGVGWIRDASGTAHRFRIHRHRRGTEVTVDRMGGADRDFRSRLRAVAYKSGYCVHCRGCEVECPTGALKVADRVHVSEAECLGCGNCATFTEKGCLAARSLDVSKGGGRVKGLSRYQKFGMRRHWLDEFLKHPDEWWRENTLGNRQFEAMRVWLRESGVTEGNRLTPLGGVLRELGAANVSTWSVIWCNLARNSNLVNWFVSAIPWGVAHTRDDLIDAMSDRLARRTRENAVGALLDLLKETPLSTDLGLVALNTRGRAVKSITKCGCGRVRPLVILYTLYRYAERRERYGFSVGDLTKELDEGPCALFGLSVEDLVRHLRGISSRWAGWLSIEIVSDLDNLFLDRNRRSEDVVALICGSEET